MIEDAIDQDLFELTALQSSGPGFTGIGGRHGFTMKAGQWMSLTIRRLTARH